MGDQGLEGIKVDYSASEGRTAQRSVVMPKREAFDKWSERRLFSEACAFMFERKGSRREWNEEAELLVALSKQS
jgi:hypothetical protein